MIVTKGLKKTYYLGETTVHALAGVDIHVKKGSLVAITGPSGSGKSTLMHVLGCLDTPDSGNYILDGKDISRLSGDDLAGIRNQKIGFVFQSFNLLPRLTALENVELPLMYSGLTDVKDRAAEALKLVGLGERMGHEPNQLSGGQRQRVAIARSIVNEPAIILADEPTGNLDSRVGQEILDIFRKLNDDGRTIVIVTHDPDIAAICGHEISMLDGLVNERRG